MCRPQDFDHKPAKKGAAPHPFRFGPHGGVRCTGDGTFPKLTCSLKRSRNPKHPRPASDQDSDHDEWISGVADD